MDDSRDSTDYRLKLICFRFILSEIYKSENVIQPGIILQIFFFIYMVFFSFEELSVKLDMS